MTFESASGLAANRWANVGWFGTIFRLTACVCSFVLSPDSVSLVLSVLGSWDHGAENPVRARREAITRHAPFVMLK